jgi:hypothetical protein
MGFKKKLDKVLDNTDNIAISTTFYGGGVEELVYTRIRDSIVDTIPVSITTKMSILYSLVGSSGGFDYYWFMPLDISLEESKIIMRKMIRLQDKKKIDIVGPLSPIDFKTTYPQAWKKLFSKKDSNRNDTDEFYAPFVIAGDQGLEQKFMTVKYIPDKTKAANDETDDIKAEDIFKVPLPNGLTEILKPK